jgi:hypothetical protein
VTEVMAANAVVEDALAKLVRFGLLTRDGERFTAVAIDPAMMAMGNCWNEVLVG